MEERINIAELLKDCPKGMELDCTMFDDVNFAGLQNSSSSIVIHTPDGYKYLNAFGCYHDSCRAKCVIFPKGKTTWKGFIPPCEFKDGDIVATTTGNWIGITTGGDSGGFMPTYCVVKSNGEFEAYFDHKGRWKFDRFATEKEKQRLFDAIKANSYKWNAETKTLEKLNAPRFKVGNRIRSIISLSYYTVIVVDIKDGQYVIKPDDTEKFPYHIPFSVETNYELVPKFDINTLKPFDQVLVRLTNNCIWMPKFFSHYDPNAKYYPFVTLDNMGYPQCIPYEKNRHLCRTTDDCNKFYKVWEK